MQKLKNNYFKYAMIFLLAIPYQFCYCSDTSDIEKLNNRNFTIVAFLPIHTGDHEMISDIDHSCTGKINEDTIPTLEALYVARDYANKLDDLLPNFSLEIIVKDFCGFSGLGTMQMSKLLFQDFCWFDEWTDTTVNPSTCYRNKTSSHLLGIIYGENLVTSYFKKFLHTFSVPSISYSAPQTECFDEDRGTKFDNTGINRTFNAITSGNTFTNDVIFHVMRKSNWTLAALHYSHSDSDIRGTRFEKYSNEENKNETICLTIKSSLEELKKKLTTKGQDGLRSPPSCHENVDIIICLCNDTDLIDLGHILQTYNRTKKYAIFAGYRETLSEYLMSTWKSDFGNLYYISPQQSYAAEFREHYLSLTVENNTRNPWFKEFWEQHFNCTFSPENETTKTECNGTETLGDKYDEFHNKYEKNSNVVNVMKSVNALAEGLKKTLKHSFNYSSDFMLDLRQNINEVLFDWFGDLVRFNELGLPDYEMLVQ